MSLVPRLALETGMPEHAVERLMRHAPIRYKRYAIPKRNGGLRAIAQPAREIKVLQRALIDIFLSGLPIHPVATAYREGMSIRQNAERHSGDGPILKLDFENFFPSIKISDWRRYCSTTGCLVAEDDIELSAALMFYRQPQLRELRLAIGAPTSPMLSNVIMFDFDEFVHSRCQKESITYTRYADDLTFSARRTGYLNAVNGIVAEALRSLPMPKLRLNGAKTVLATRKYKRFVTGLVLANDGRVTIGRERKRVLHAQVHRFASGKMNDMECAKLSGYLAFVHSVEAEFISTLARKYGEDVLKRLTSDVPRALQAARRSS